LKAIADSYGVKPENLPEVIQNLSDTVRNPDADPTLRQSALASLTEMMGAVHNEAYVDGNKGLKDAIDKSPAVVKVDIQGKDQNGSAEDGIFSQVGEQAKIYLNQIAGNAFGDFAYINDNGEVVFRSCFVAGTLVWTKDGQRPIETIKVGDIVLSWNEESGQNEYRTVTETFINPTTTILKITYADGTAIETTWNHQFYLQQGLWVNAKDLMAGDLSLNSQSETVVVASIVEIIKNETVYNFEVEKNHTYFVGKGGILVHNPATYPVMLDNMPYIVLKQELSNCKSDDCRAKVMEKWKETANAQVELAPTKLTAESLAVLAGVGAVACAEACPALYAAGFTNYIRFALSPVGRLLGLSASVKGYTEYSGATGGGIAVENIVKSGNTLLLENFSILSRTNGRDLLIPAKQMLELAKSQGVDQVLLRGTAMNPVIAEKLGVPINGTFEILIPATKEGIITTLRLLGGGG
ncbi:polymorphic toxin-type HINT domain-containing protein, partial [Leptospira koniambonensis]|uniref:polymorphic toxin-type HINT domain-containing protein n=1 Tax=Leptospira koniambonensis TaxID=2484950 RepID=UPI003EBDEFB8